jgi:DNA-binding NarL/FixJ family response regulator
MYWPAAPRIGPCTCFVAAPQAKDTAIIPTPPSIHSLRRRCPYYAGKLYPTFLETLVSHRERILTPREQTVAKLVAEGHSNKQIADILNVAVKTVETHRAECLRKLGLTSSAALVRYAIRTNLVEA